MILIISLWILFGAASAYYGQIKGRDPILWFVLGALFGVISLIILFFLPTLEPKEEPIEEQVIAEEPLLNTFKSIRLRDWFYIDNDQKQQGPVTFTLLRRKLYDGTLNNSTLVWSEGMEGWSPANSIEELKD